MPDLDLVHPASAEPTSQPSAPEPAIPASAAQPAIPAGPVAVPTLQPPPDAAMVPSYRLREVREQAVREAQHLVAEREAFYRAQTEQLQNQVRALTGVAPLEDPQIAVVREQFGQIFPGLMRLEEQADQLLQAPKQTQDVEALQKYIYEQHAMKSVERLYDLAEKTFSAHLNDASKDALHAAFAGFVSASPERVDRYLRDPSLVNEFWQNFSAALIDPARRIASAAIQTAGAPRAIPQDTPGGVPRPVPPAPPANIDERMVNAWTNYKTIVQNR